MDEDIKERFDKLETKFDVFIEKHEESAKPIRDMVIQHEEKIKNLYSTIKEKFTSMNWALGVVITLFGGILYKLFTK